MPAKKVKPIRLFPEVSYVVSLYHRWDDLRVCMAMLNRQTHQDFEVIVTDNTELPKHRNVARVNEDIVKAFGARFSYVNTTGKIPVSDCYWSAELGMTLATGRWLCFPCEDVYYPPEWTQRMLAAARARNLDIVLCENSVTGPDTCGVNGYMPLELGSQSFPGYKPSFLSKATVFREWVNKPTVGACSGVDKTTLQRLMQSVRWGVCKNLWYFHN